MTENRSTSMTENQDGCRPPTAGQGAARMRLLLIVLCGVQFIDAEESDPDLYR